MTDLFSNQREQVPSGCSSCVFGRNAPPTTTAATNFDSDNDQLNTNGFLYGSQIQPDATDIALAKEMNSLSVKERERVFDDIHGVAKIQEETPEFLSKCFKEMDEALALLPRTKRRALDRALFLKPSLQNDTKFKLKFLRADCYSPKEAAQRMGKYFEEKLLLFGESRLVKKITLDDLEEEDLERLNYVACQVLLHKDQSGRPIWFFDIQRYDLENVNSMARCYWYQVMSTVEDEVAQLKGICDVCYCPGNLLALPSKLAGTSSVIMRSGRLMDGLPCRITTFHFCYDDPRVRNLILLVGKALGKQVQVRMRAHFGSDVEIQYSLMTFGIKCYSLFRSTENGSGRELQAEYIRRRKQIEQRETEDCKQKEFETGIILYPQPCDVLVGRGRPYQDFPGNQFLMALVSARLDKFGTTDDRFEKTCMFMEVVKLIQDGGGRFLQRTPEGWVVASDKVAREKTSSSFRNQKTGKSSSGSKDTTASKFDGIANLFPAISCDDSCDRSAKRIRYDPGIVDNLY